VAAPPLLDELLELLELELGAGLELPPPPPPPPPPQAVRMVRARTVMMALNVLIDFMVNLLLTIDAKLNRTPTIGSAADGFLLLVLPDNPAVQIILGIGITLVDELVIGELGQHDFGYKLEKLFSIQLGFVILESTSIFLVVKIAVVLRAVVEHQEVALEGTIPTHDHLDFVTRFRMSETESMSAHQSTPFDLMIS
jgi:hypothetical protein